MKQVLAFFCKIVLYLMVPYTKLFEYSIDSFWSLFASRCSRYLLELVDMHLRHTRVYNYNKQRSIVVRKN
jgi:hypothetical protein